VSFEVLETFTEVCNIPFIVNPSGTTFGELHTTIFLEEGLDLRTLVRFGMTPGSWC
jgi:hypothetical protein